MLRCYAVLYIVPQTCNEASQSFMDIDGILANCTYTLHG